MSSFLCGSAAGEPNGTLKMRTRVVPLANALTPLQSLITRRWNPKWACHHRRQSQPPWLRAFTTAAPLGTEQDKPYYITTPIFYVNAAPHVGHMYTMVLGDVLKRWQVLKGRKAIFLTGTDEHGMKIQRAAAQAGVEPKDFCDTGAEVFRDLARRIGLDNEIFSRTTDRKHREGVEYAWQMLEERGHIYESKHEGWYSVSDETFYPQSQVHLIVDPPTGRKVMVSVETGKEVEWTSERNYHFRLSAFREKLLDFYARNPSYIVPHTRMSEVVQQVSDGLEDLSISRPSSRLSWGVPVPTDSSQTIYVWLDALLNYATAVGYPFTPGTEARRGWAPDVQVVGKDIVRFHCIYWPAFLMALDLPLHRQVLTHAHWTLGKQKMAKSSGNGVNPFFALERFGLDPLRWYLIHQGGIADDADYDNSFIVEKYNRGLKGGLGNLASRVMRGKGWDIRRAVRRYAHPSSSSSAAAAPEEPPAPPAVLSGSADDSGDRLYASLARAPASVDAHMQALLPNRALQRAMKAVHDTNGYLQNAKPWALAAELQRLRAQREELDDDDDNITSEAWAASTHTMQDLEAQIDRSIFLAVEALRLAGIMLQPFIPTSAARLLDAIGVAPERRGWEWCRVGSDDSYGEPGFALDREGLFPPLAK